MLVELTDPQGNPKLHCCAASPCDHFFSHRNVMPKQVRARVRVRVRVRYFFSHRNVKPKQVGARVAVRVRTLPLSLSLTLTLTLTLSRARRGFPPGARSTR